MTHVFIFTYLQPNKIILILFDFIYDLSESFLFINISLHIDNVYLSNFE